MVVKVMEVVTEGMGDCFCGGKGGSCHGDRERL